MSPLVRADPHILAGKSTLLQILAGKRLTRSNARVLGNEVFFNTPQGVTYLGAACRLLDSTYSASDAARPGQPRWLSRVVALGPLVPLITLTL